MSILTDLEAALEAKQEAWAAFTAYTHGADQQALLDEYDIACGRYEALLTDDTIRALLEAVEAAEREPRCPFCAEERHISGWPTQPHLSDCPLAPLFPDGETGVVQDTLTSTERSNR